MHWILFIVIIAQNGVSPEYHVATSQIHFTGSSAEDLCNKAKSQLIQRNTDSYCFEATQP